MASASASLSFSSSLLPSPLPHPHDTKTKKHRAQVPNFNLIHCSVTSTNKHTSFSSESAVAAKKRLWKKGEYPGVSETSIPGYRSKRTPIKNLKKKLERKAKAKAWVNTVAETFSDHVLKKQWFQALQVSNFNSILFSFFFFSYFVSGFLIC